MTRGPLGAMPGPAFPFTPSQRYPDPAVLVLHPDFARYRLYSSTLEQVASGMRWAEGPVWLPDSGCLLVSDIPCNRIMRYDERSGAFTVFRENANFANGNTLDRQGRLVTCEHSVTRRVVRTEPDGTLTVLADRYQGRRLNAPNDVVVRRDASVWFTDPLYGIAGAWEGTPAPAEQPGTFVFRLAPDGTLDAVITDLRNPNGLAFSPDERHLYVVESGGTPRRGIWRYDVAADGTVGGRALLVDAGEGAAPDGLRVDRDGNLWCGWGSNGLLADAPVAVGGHHAWPPRGRSEDLDGVMVFDPQGRAIGFIRLPERCANLAFGGPGNNRLYMASSHSLYALYVGTQGAT